MNTFIYRLKTDWHPMRIIRLVFGVWAVVQAVQMHDYAIGFFGLFFLYQAVTNTGCCGSQGCGTPPARKVQHLETITEYEEIK